MKLVHRNTFILLISLASGRKGPLLKGPPPRFQRHIGEAKRLLKDAETRAVPRKAAKAIDQILISKNLFGILKFFK